MPTLQRATTIVYPAGTRTSTFKMDYDSDEIEYGLIAYAVRNAIHQFRVDHRNTPLVEDLFITIAFTTCEMLVEVSDRLTR